MSVPRFFVPTLAGGVIVLDDAESRHSLRARRLSVGDDVVLFDGQGHEAAGRIAEIVRGIARVQVDKVVSRPRLSPALTLAVAVPKGPRQGTLIEKCTELGVRAIWPIVTQRAVAGASEHRVDKWRKTAIEAAKQSGQCWLPELAEPRALGDVIGLAKGFDCVLVATPDGLRPTEIADSRSILAFVGPEGGWTAEELAMLVGAGARPITLGPNVLRIETAAIVLAALVHMVSS